MNVVNVDFIVQLCTWTNPTRSASYLVFTNLCCWFLQRQRPVYVISLIILANYLRSLWKRVRHEILVDPPDREEWANLYNDDIERTIVDYAKSTWKSWTVLRKNNYYMWIVLTSLFWIALIKIGTVVDFVTIMFLISNGLFILGPLFKTFPVELLEPTTGGDDCSDDSPSVDQRDGFITAEPFVTPSSWGRIIQDTLLKTYDSVMRSSSPTNRPSSSPSMETTTGLGPESESVISQPANIHSPGSESSDDDFLFDSRHFESRSSSTSSSTSQSNSFELIHF